MLDLATNGGQIDMTKIGTIQPLLFDENLIIALSNKWVDEFTKIPEFDVIIDNEGRLCIISSTGVA